MKLKKAMMAGAAAALFVGSVLNVSAAKTASDDYVNALKESNRENLIINVEAYKAAYSDLAAAFGDDTEAYIEHYLTIGVYEGRTKGVLFDPLAYAEAYGDVKSTYGNNIPAIIEHYLTFGIAENRTAGTAGGYADIAEAEAKGAFKIPVQRSVAKINSTAAYNVAADTVNAVSDNNNAAVDNTVSTGNSIGNAISSNKANASTNTSAGTAANTTNNTVPNTVPANNNTGNTASSNTGNTTNNNTGNTTSNNINNTISNNTAAAPTTPGNAASGTASDNYTVPPADTSTASNEISGYVPPQNNNNYHHTTSIYDNDESTLIRVEYYDENNKLFEFSQVTNHDSSSNSYTEDVYYTDQDSGEIVHDRTDTYVNGELTSSEKH